ncbi:hypothetical protein [Vibrio splendidus]|uniref:hypothetical protein n=1 Tax=Vibrio splendidus TaxID=29497 RepID=UPI001648A118|nr:hypothetical protein [Vibrio splendidus]
MATKRVMSVFKAAIVPRLETPPVISAMITASRNAITSFYIEMRSIQVGVAYRPHQHPPQTNTDSG